jgi:hypothetical protein
MRTTVPGIYEESGVIRLRQPLPLPSGTQVLVSLDIPGVESETVPTEPVIWPNILERLQGIYGSKVISENAVLADRQK